MIMGSAIRSHRVTLRPTVAQLFLVVLGKERVRASPAREEGDRSTASAVWEAQELSQRPCDREGGKAMAWNLSGQVTECWSCKLMCPCWLGPTPVPDQGWCSGAILYDIEQGQIDGIDVGGSKVVFAADWPGNFFGGQGTA